MATSPLPSRGHRRGRKGHVTLAFSGVPNAKRGDKIGTGYLTPTFSWAQNGGEVLRNPAISEVPNAKRRTKSEEATLPLPSPEPRRGRTCYVTPALSRVPNAKRGDKNQEWLPQPYFLGGPKEGRGQGGGGYRKSDIMLKPPPPRQI